MRSIQTTRRSGAKIVALLVGSSLALAACGGGDDSSEGAGGGQVDPDGTFSVYIGDPENPLIPGNTNETEGGQVVDSLFTGLVEYNLETNEAEYTGVAESIESEDQTTFTVTLNPDWTFHDGTPVTAQSYVDAWNYTAYSPNAQTNSYFFGNIAGYGDLQAPSGDDGEPSGDPAATELSGLAVVDDLTFTVTLAAPYAQWPTTVGYTAFNPLPEAFFDDPEAYGEQPIGNGPFMAEEPFVPGQGITLTRYEDYAGEPAKAAAVEYRVYTDVNTAFTEVESGDLDVVDTVPSDRQTTVEDDFGDRYVSRARGDITSLGFPTYDERFSDPTVRQAFSMAIDREAITTNVLQGINTPADSFVSPVVDGYREGACTYCVFDAERANDLLDEAGFDRSQPVDLWFNAGADHDTWMQAIGNQLRENIDVEYQLRGDLQFAEYLPLQDEKGMTGPFRSGWIMDYPTMENFLGPLYTTGGIPPAGANVTYFSDEEFDGLVAGGNSAATEEEAVAGYQAAEDYLNEQMPATPLWYGLIQSVNSERVQGVVVNSFGRIQVQDIEVLG